MVINPSNTKSSYLSHLQTTRPSYLILLLKQSNKHSLTRLRICKHLHLRSSRIPWLHPCHCRRSIHAVLAQLCQCCSYSLFSCLSFLICGYTWGPLGQGFAAIWLFWVFLPPVPLWLRFGDWRAPRCFLSPGRWQHSPLQLWVATSQEQSNNNFRLSGFAHHPPKPSSVFSASCTSFLPVYSQDFISFLHIRVMEFICALEGSDYFSYMYYYISSLNPA